MTKECFRFLIKPAKNLKIRLKEAQRKVKFERRGAPTESQLFIMELARELSWICQLKRSDILAHIWTADDMWPPAVCEDFIIETVSILEMKVSEKFQKWEVQILQGAVICGAGKGKTEQPSLSHTDLYSEKRDWKEHLLWMLEGEKQDLRSLKRTILEWAWGLRTRYPHGIWPGEAVLMMLDDLEMQWKKGRLAHLRSAMELIIWVALGEHLNKDLIPRLWLVQKQKSQNISASPYISHILWNWICSAAEEVTIDLDTAHPSLRVSADGKRICCTPEPQNVPHHRQRFSGWTCALASEGFSSGRHYWEVEVGDRDWRLGIARESALRKGYRSLNTQSGYFTLRLERGTELRALTLPVTPLVHSPVPRLVGVYLDFEEGQLSFYDVQRRTHIYTYNESFGEKVFPVFGTAEMVRAVVVRPAALRWPCLCTGPCPFG